MKKKINSNFILSIILCLIPFVISAIFYEQLPEKMAIHFNFAGEADNFAPKIFTAFGLPLIMLCLHLYTWFMLENDPKKASASITLKSFGKYLVPVMSIVMQASLTAYALELPFGQKFQSSLFIGLLFIVIGNYLPKCRQNYTVGIKLPWTLHDANNWNKTHRMSGYLFILCGLIIFINSFFNSMWVLYPVLALVIFFPAVYSYLLYKKTSDDSEPNLED